jgi:hypothetical protein
MMAKHPLDKAMANIPRTMEDLLALNIKRAGGFMPEWVESTLKDSMGFSAQSIARAKKKSGMKIVRVVKPRRESK